MRSVYLAENLFDAQWVKDALEAQGIPAFVAGAHLVGAIGDLPVAGLIDVRVPDGAFGQAQAIVAEFDAFLSERPLLDGDEDASPQPA